MHSRIERVMGEAENRDNFQLERSEIMSIEIFVVQGITESNITVMALTTAISMIKIKIHSFRDVKQRIKKEERRFMMSFKRII